MRKFIDLITELDQRPSDEPERRSAELREKLMDETEILRNSGAGLPNIVRNPHIRGGKPTIEDTRWDALDLAAQTELEGEEVMLDEYDDLTLPMIRAAQAFAREQAIAPR